MQQIIPIGGAGLSQPDKLLLERYIVAQTGSEHPKVAFLHQASGENKDYVIQFYRAFLDLDCRPSHLSLFDPHTANIADYLLGQDVIYVGGGNTKSMLALWREWGIDAILRQALDAGIVLTGVSAGAICWFERGTTDSIPGDLTALPCLGFLSGSLSPHYDSEPKRRPTYQRMIGGGEISGGLRLRRWGGGAFRRWRAQCGRQRAPERQGLPGRARWRSRARDRFGYELFGLAFCV